MSALLPGAIADIYADTAERRSLTQADYLGLQTAQAHWTDLTSEEQHCVKRILHWLKQGRLTLSQELSVVF